MTSIRVHRRCEGPLPAYIPPGRAKSPAAYFPASRQSTTPLKITDEEKETNALKQLAISQNTVIKVFH